MKLLVITPTLGESPWLALTVASVANNAPGATHVLVAPAGVTSRLAAHFPQAHVQAEPAGGGLYAAVNAGAAETTSWDFLTYLNDDDAFETGFASVISGSVPKSGIVYGNVHYVDEHGRDLGRMPIARPGWVPTILSDGAAPFTQQGTIISRAAWTQLAGFNVRWRLAADYDFWCRAAAAGISFQRVPRTVASFRLHGRQLSANQDAMRTELAAIRAQHVGALVRHRRPEARLWFRFSSLGQIWERRRRAGVWTSAALYARYSRIT